MCLRGVTDYFSCYSAEFRSRNRSMSSCEVSSSQKNFCFTEEFSTTRTHQPLTLKIKTKHSGLDSGLKQLHERMMLGTF